MLTNVFTLLESSNVLCISIETVRPPSEVDEKAQMEQSEKDQQRLLKTQQRQRLVKDNQKLRTTWGTMKLTGKYEKLVRNYLVHLFLPCLRTILEPHSNKFVHLSIYTSTISFDKTLYMNTYNSC